MAADAATITVEPESNKTGPPDAYRRPGGYGGSAGRLPSINNAKWRRGGKFPPFAKSLGFMRLFPIETVR